MATTPDVIEIMRKLICELAADICCLSRMQGPIFRAKVKDIPRRAQLIEEAATVIEEVFKREFEREFERGRED